MRPNPILPVPLQEKTRTHEKALVGNGPLKAKEWAGDVAHW